MTKTIGLPFLCTVLLTQACGHAHAPLDTASTDAGSAARGEDDDPAGPDVSPTAADAGGAPSLDAGSSDGTDAGGGTDGGILVAPSGGYPSPFPVPTITISGTKWYVSPSGNDSAAGSSSAPFKTIAKASAKAVPGDGVLLMAGNYGESIVPARSGTQPKPIVYAAADPSHHPVLVSPSAGAHASAIYISGFSDVIVDGIDVNGGGTNDKIDKSFASFVIVDGGATRVMISRGVFRNANGYNGVQVSDASYVTIRNNTVDMVGYFIDPDEAGKTGGDGELAGDDIAVDVYAGGPPPTHCLVEYNTLTHAGHDLLALGGAMNVAQYNVMDNDWSDIEGKPAGYRNAVAIGTGNLFQKNYMAHNGPGADFSYYFVYQPLMKAEGANNIVRQNVLAYSYYEGIMSSVVDASSSSESALPGGNDHIYSNTMYQLDDMAWCPRLTDWVRSKDIFKNNLVMSSRMSPTSWFPYSDFDIVFTGIASDYQTYGPTYGDVVVGNMFWPKGGVDPQFRTDPSGPLTLSAAEAKYPTLFFDNKKAQAQFVSATPTKHADFALAAGSRGIGEGVYLTTVAGAGTSSQLVVADAYYFTDGFAGVIPGDVIQLAGSTTTAQITSIDYATRTLTLSRALTFVNGQGVALAYTGSAPNVGAY